MANIKRLWNKNFVILWFGQLVSDFGNAAFAVALGFWVLEMTKSAQYPFGNTALMGLIEACFAIPGVLLGPVAGAFADRHNRKLIIVTADFVRGVLFVLMGLMVYLNIFPFFMIYPIAILAGACGAFFGPSISSAIPDIVPMDSLSKANSARSFSSTVTQLLGSSFGGLLFAILTAPILILINGISFLTASAAQLFMKVPVRPVNPQRKNIFHDIVEGVKYTFGNRGIRTLVLTGMMINFFAVCGMTLMTPLFKSEPGFGVERYGYIMGTMMAGMIIGMVIFTIVKVKPSQRAGIFGLSMMVMVFSMVPVGLITNVYWLFPFAFLSGISNAVVNVLLQTIMQTTVPPENRGKVFGILGTVMGGLQPIAMAVSGVFGLLVGIRPAITICFSLLVLAALPLLFDRHFKAYINTDITASGANTEAVAEAGTPVLAPAEE